MDGVSIAGSSLLVRTAQTEQALSTAMMKQAASQQDQVANILAQNVQQAVKPVAQNNDYGFSTYA